MKQSHLTVKISFTNTQWQQMTMRPEAEITFGQNHNIHGILMLSTRLQMQERPQVNKDFSLSVVFLLYFVDVIQLLETETKKYITNI
jgi:hypothetical protein